ncbi:MAG TPA: hypothetical protein DEP35_02760 [Deltaproteobacteria bacterium]|jgi:hypothetical protein|nr:hypothetical protein [Deltaproteobacteria bacterium]
MNRTARRIARGIALFAALLLFVFAWLAWRGGEIISGYTAKVLCSCVFVSGRDATSCLREDLGTYMGLFQAQVDLAGRAVDSRALLVRSARAEYHDGLGCTLR